MKIKSLLLVVAISVVVSACGSSDDSVTPPLNDIPAPAPILPNLPRIEITDLEGPIQDEPKVTAQMRVSEYDENGVASIGYEGFIGVEYRGSSSQFFYDKKGLGIETRDSLGEGLDTELLGFPEEEDWVLHGPYGDKSLIRNALMFDLAEEFSGYSSRSKFVDVYLEGAYHGVYLLLEKIKRDSNRVDINKLKDDENDGEDVTGGYIIKLDKTNGEHEGDPGAFALFTDDMSFLSEHGTKVSDSEVHFIYHYPKPAKITEEQKAYIQGYVNDFEDALAGDDFADEVLGYSNFINIDTFVDYFLAAELSGNVDGFRLSTFLVKDKNEKLSMGPPWDYNLAFGNVDYCEGWRSDMWIHRMEFICAGGPFGTPFWWSRLLEDEAFVARVKLRWVELRAAGLSDQSVTDSITSKVDFLNAHGAVEDNFDRWDILGQYVWPNFFIGNSHAQEVSYLQTWLADRLTWMDTAINDL